MIKQKQNIKTLLSETVEVYKNKCLPDLETMSKEIEEIFKVFLQEYKDEYDLTSINSAYEGKYYKFSSRVKTPESLAEKMIRTSQILYLMDKFDMKTTEDISSGSEKLKKYFIECEDIIGLKIIGELDVDLKNIYKVIIEKNDELQAKEVYLDMVKKQPVIMKNGLNIYKIKGIYKKKYSFELQLKTQLESAWGDMEHQLFYKDYEFTPVKNSVQGIMNEVGKLLHSIDSLLYKIRASKDNYKDEQKLLKFTETIHNSYSTAVETYLEIPYKYNLINVSTFLFSIFEFIFPDKNVIELTKPQNIKFITNQFEVEHEYMKNFIEVKNLNLDLQILELLILNWMNSDGVYKNDAESYSKSLEVFLGKYGDSLVKIYEVENKEEFDLLFKSILKNVKNNEAFTGSKQYSLVIDYYKVLSDILGDEILEGFNLTQYRYISLIFSLYVFDGQITKVLDQAEETFEYDEEYSVLIDTFSEINLRIDQTKKTNGEKYELLKPIIEHNNNLLKIVTGNGSEPK